METNVNLISDQQKAIDDQALIKANSIDWQSTNPVVKNQPRVFTPSPRPKTTPLKGKPLIDIDESSFDELSEVYAEAMIRIDTYMGFPKEIRGTLRDQIIGTTKFMVLVKIKMAKIANPEQSIFLKEFEQLQKKCIELSSGENGGHIEKINILKHELSKAMATNTAANKESKAALKLKHIELSLNRDSLVLRNFKQLVKERCSEVAYLSMIREAGDLADKELGLNNG